MDQAKTDLPRSGTGAQTNVMNTRVHGLLAHGQHKYFFIVLPTCQKTANQVVSCIAHAVAKSPRTARTLHVQLDGAGDNWCVTSFLVVWGC